MTIRFSCYRFWGACLIIIAACDTPRSESEPQSEQPNAVQPCSEGAEQVVTELGGRMRFVSLLAPDSVVTRSLRNAYHSLVTPELLTQWEAAPASAPGREVSNPWPRQIAIGSIEADDGLCRVMGDVIYVTTADTTGVIEQRAITLTVRSTDGRISEFAWGADSPAQVVRNYYDALRAEAYEQAYMLWADSGRASGQSFAEFREGFADTEQVQVTVSDSVRIEGAAGSHYATVPVVIDAVLRDGKRQHFEGTYVLRRSLVPGASAEQRKWQIHAADIQAR